ncbi:MAG: c-type cytochrome, partial [Bryobacteraceae bacterium]
MRIAVVFFAVTFAAVGQHAHPVEDGKALYQKKCVACHGENLAGGRGPTLASGAWHWGSTDADLTRNIVKGIPGTQMPAIVMPEPDAAAIVAYLRDLRGEGAKERSTGDPQAGRKLFFGAAACSHCHMFGGTGGRLGPDLSGIRADKKIAEIRKAILDPNQSIRPGFDRVSITLKSGRTVTGLQKGADTFSVLVMDMNEGIHSIPKAQ